MLREKYVQMFKEFNSQLHMYAKVIRILSISLLLPSKLQDILGKVKKAIQKDYGIVIKRLHLYYDMKLVTFGIDGDRNFIIQFLVFIQPIYTTTIDTVSNRNSNHS